MQYGGIGLESMRERAESLNGEFSLESRPGRGTKIYVMLPMK
jgi:signal transduction histidine kinase